MDEDDLKYLYDQIEKMDSEMSKRKRNSGQWDVYNQQKEKRRKI